MDHNLPPDSEQFDGTLEAFYEMGMDGHAWALEETGKQGYDGLHIMRSGDFLRVFNDAARKQVLWEGVIDLDDKIERRPLPRAPHIEAQWIDSIGSVMGIQSDMHPKLWAEMFVQHKPASFIQHPKNRITK